MGTRTIPFSKELWIEKMISGEPAKKWFRLAPGTMVRLKSAYIIRCESFTKMIWAISLKYIVLISRKCGNDTSNIQVKGTIHCSAQHAATARL
jgi:glutaminyl-tRNA synthetase